LTGGEGVMPGEEMRWLFPWIPAEALRAANDAQQGSASLWTIVTVVVAALGSAFVAWQAAETHRTTALSQLTLQVSQSLAIDSARSRLDQNAPRVDVYVEQISVVAADSPNAPGSQIESGARWNLPAEAARFLRVQAQVSVVNLMADRTIHLKVRGLHDTAMRADTEVLLIPSAKLLYFLTATFTLSQWIANWEAHHAGKALPHVAEGFVISGDDRDEGVVDTWPLDLAAWPVQPVTGSEEAWQLSAEAAGDDWFHITIRPLRERSYWISQRNKIPMPEPSYYQPGSQGRPAAPPRMQ
jgi:hypothetical protein